LLSAGVARSCILAAQLSISEVSTPAPPRTSRIKLAGLFFLLALPMGIWTVPLGNIMWAYGKAHLLPWVLAMGALSAFISPLIIGSLADQRVSPTQVLRWLSLGTALLLATLSYGIEAGWADLTIVATSLALALVMTPMWGLSSSIVLSQLERPGKQFGPVRAWATIGWMAGGWLVSYGLHSDSSVVSGYVAAGLWLVVGLYTLTLPKIQPPDAGGHRGWKQILGLDALALLRERNHRMVFLTAALYSIPLAAFYPYCVRHLKELGVAGPAGVMTLGQITEVLVMLVLAGLMTRVRLKWVFLSGIGFGLLRYVLFLFDTPAWVVAGIVLHGLAYTLYFITTQIYLEDRISPALRTRAQALLTLLTGGVGNLLGFLGSGWWLTQCEVTSGGPVLWRTFWGGLALLTALVFGFFALFYRGRGRHLEHP
jgi:MFS family permease